MEQKRKMIAATVIVLILLSVLLVFGRGGAKNTAPQGTTGGEAIAAEPVADESNGQSQGKEMTTPSGEDQTGENTNEKDKNCRLFNGKSVY